MKKIGFIGAGNMGLPLLMGATKLLGAEQLTFFCADEFSNKRAHETTGVEQAESLEKLVQTSECVLLAVKPQSFGEVLPVIKANTFDGQVIISLAPGVTVEYLSQETGGKTKIVRTMPNTPAMVGEGMTAVCYGSNDFTAVEKKLVQDLFETVGKMVELPERLMDAAVVANGSSPAFVYIFMEALADGAVKFGIPRATAYEMVAQTVIGSAKMLLETGEHPGKLKDNVCSPGGTTIAAVAALEEAGFRNAVIKACDACYEKSTGLKK